MPKLEIFLESLSPLLVGTGLAIGNVQSGRKYIPGSAWRGAVASLILSGLRQRKHSGRPVAVTEPDPLFRQAFLGQDAARFGFLYPVSRDAADLAGTTTLPIPLTARTCKHAKGFEGHGVYDGLLNRLREAAEGIHPYSREAGQCPRCRQRMDRMRGFAARVYPAESYITTKVGRRSYVRVGLNRYTETAQDQVLYVLDAVVPDREKDGREKPLTFVGAWHGNDQQLQTLRFLLDNHLLPHTKGGYELSIGTARARGMGQVCLHLGNPLASSHLEERLRRFQPQAGGGPLDADHLYAALTLRSPLLLLDEFGLLVAQVTAAALEAYCPNVPPELEVLSEYSVVEQESGTGWAAAWGLPKPVMPALAAGSVLVVRAPGRRRDELLDFLTSLEAEGLGERRAEGWGEVLVCDPFHVIHDEGR
ncbi:MAG TPA: hypothetical protein DEP84_03860 [Chloroflexi bacterium]|nr:hypothetical protein [Chloroflexota bacterium]